MNATPQGDQRGEEEATEQEEAPEETSEGREDPGDLRLLNSVDLRLAMIPGFLEYKEAYGLKSKP